MKEQQEKLKAAIEKKKLDDAEKQAKLDKELAEQIRASEEAAKKDKDEREKHEKKFQLQQKLAEKKREIELKQQEDKVSAGPEQKGLFMQIKPTERTSKPSSEMDCEENQNKHPEDSYQIDKQADLPQNLTPVQKQYEANPQ